MELSYDSVSVGLLLDELWWAQPTARVALSVDAADGASSYVINPNCLGVVGGGTARRGGRCRNKLAGSCMERQEGVAA